MDRAKESVKKVLGRSGHHDTTIHETVAPAVQNETIQQTQHERTTAAIDREVHQDHYHTTEQPISHSEVLPEQHHHREVPIEHKSYEHDSPDVVKRKLAEEQKRYYDTQQRVEGEKTRSAEPVVAGEHKHHHVHETIQPVVNKQTIEPHVVHTTVPIHEVHHNEAQHHSASALPAISMDQFKNQGGVLGGRDERRDFFPGEPKSFGNSSPGMTMDGHGVNPKRDIAEHNAAGRRSSSSSSSSDGEGGRISRSKKHGLVGGTRGPTTTTNTTTNTTTSGYGSRDGRYGTDGAVGSNNAYSSSTGHNPATGSTNSSTPTTSGTGVGKPSLMDKLNPKVDATGDGKAGFMK